MGGQAVKNRPVQNIPVQAGTHVLTQKEQPSATYRLQRAVELLSRFELLTSSLPKIFRLLQLVVC